MTTRSINIMLILWGLSICVNGQTLKEKIEKLFETDKKLIEQTNKFYNAKAQIVKSVTIDYRNSESITINDYLYNDKGQLVKETFSGLRSYHDSLKRKHWTDTIIISTKHYLYDSFGQLKFEKEYGFQCNLDSCDIIEFFYDGKLLRKKFCTNDCSMKRLNYNYPIYYKYDKNDSLILEQAWGPTDTTKIWYTHSYDYCSLPEKIIYEKHYRKDDSLQLDNRTVIKTEYLKDGRKSKIIFLEKASSYKDFEYHENGLLKSQVSVINSRPKWKLVYHYDKRNNIIRLETYNDIKGNDEKLKLNYYQTYHYKYY